MSKLGSYYKALDERSKRLNPAPTSIGQVLTIKPLSVAYNGLTLSFANGDNIYINNLMLDDNINLNVPSMDEKQNINEVDPMTWIAFETPEKDYTAKISGTQKQFLTDFYNWTKAVHNRFIIHIGDYVAVQKLGNNTYLILDKLQKVENEQ